VHLQVFSSFTAASAISVAASQLYNLFETPNLPARALSYSLKPVTNELLSVGMWNIGTASGNNVWS